MPVPFSLAELTAVELDHTVAFIGDLVEHLIRSNALTDEQLGALLGVEIEEVIK